MNIYNIIYICGLWMPLPMEIPISRPLKDWVTPKLRFAAGNGRQNH